MEKLHMSSMVVRLAQATGKWAMYVNLGMCDTTDDIDAILRALPWLNLDYAGSVRAKDDGQCLADGFVVVLFETEKEAMEVYEAIPGDDNPPPDNQPGFYAMLVSPVDGIVTENT